MDDPWQRAVKEGLLQIVLVTTLVAISRRVSRFKLQLRDRHEARRSRKVGDDRPTPKAWEWSLDTAYEGFLRLESKNT